MLTLAYPGIHSIHADHGIDIDQFSDYSSKIGTYLEKIHARAQGFYSIVDDQSIVDEIQQYADSVKGRFDHIVVLGIGGSALGTLCIQQSLGHLLTMQRDNAPQLHVIDNIDPQLLTDLESVIDYSKTLFIVATKSGGTPETLALYFYFRKKLTDQGLDHTEHCIFITDPQKGLLRKISTEEGVKAFAVPENVGGRFSVLTAVGLVPAALIGIDISALLAGGREMRDLFLSEDFEKNLPYQLAVIQYLLAQKDKCMTVIMPYSQRLIRFADWYRQLLAESIGKEKNNAGEVVNVGLTPINALGVTDQHSQSQLYNEGPHDKFFIFIDVENLGPKLEIPALYPDVDQVNYLHGVDFAHLMKTELDATEQSFTDNNRPTLRLTIDQVDEKNLGSLFMFFEASIAFLGEFFDIDAFDQPGVELAKNLTREYLSKQ